MSIQDEAESLRQKIEEEVRIEVRIALFGQPGSGKSALINRLMGDHVAKESQKTDETKDSQTYSWNGVHLVDLPGYGTARFPKESYLDEFKIRTFDIFLCVFAGKLWQADTEFFRLLHGEGHICLLVRNKQDDIWQKGRSPEELKEEIREEIVGLLGVEAKVHFTSCRTGAGIAELSDAIRDRLGEVGESKQRRYAEAAKAYTKEFLQKKREACESIVLLQAGKAAVNAVNPIPGLDIAVDVSILVDLFKRLREAYGLTDDVLTKYEKLGLQGLAALINEIVRNGAKSGVIHLLRKLAGREAAKRFAKYIPIVGPVIAASAGFAVTCTVGQNYLERCHELAIKILEKETTPNNPEWQNSQPKSGVKYSKKSGQASRSSRAKSRRQSIRKATARRSR